jgi:hypothetical protein
MLVWLILINEIFQFRQRIDAGMLEMYIEWWITEIIIVQLF